MGIIRYRASRLVTDLNGDFVSNVDYSSMREDRDSWRRTCERLEREKIELRANLAAAEKTIEQQAECLVLLTEEIWTGDDLDAVLSAVKGAVELLKKGK